MRYQDMNQLMRNLSPDIQVIDDGTRTTLHAETPKETPKPANNTRVLEDKFLSLWGYLDGRELVREYRFHPTRRWRFDFALPDIKVAFEIQGGLYESQSGHRSFTGVQRDYEKLNAATLLGWRVFQVTSSMLKDHDTMAQMILFCSPQ